MGSTSDVGETESFCLKWNDYAANISVAFRDIRRQSDFFDVTLLTKDGSLQAHKVILSACSDFFRESLKRLQPRNNQGSHTIAIFLKGVSQHQLQSILEFMYQGEVNVTNDDLTEFLAVAEELKVKGLTNKEDPPVVPPSPVQSKPTKSITPKPYSTPGATSQVSGANLKRSITPSTSKGLTSKKIKPDEVLLAADPTVVPTFAEHHNFKTDPEIIIEHSGPTEGNADEDFDGYENYYEDDEEIGDESVSSDPGQSDSNQAFGPYNYLIKLPDGRSKCTLCEKELSTSNALKHATRMHEPADFYECSICLKVIKHKLDFRNHLYQIHGLKGRNLVASYGRFISSQRN